MGTYVRCKDGACSSASDLAHGDRWQTKGAKQSWTLRGDASSQGGRTSDGLKIWSRGRDGEHRRAQATIRRLSRTIALVSAKRWQSDDGGNGGEKFVLN